MDAEAYLKPEVVAAFLSMVATGFAAYATWKGPQRAAQLAEEMRRQSEEVNERRRMRLALFGTLMQERAFIASPEAVQALNSIDVVFNDAEEVREAWAELLNALGAGTPEHVREERIRKLLKAMALELGIGAGLRMDDLSRVYYPTGLAEEARLKRAEITRRLAQIDGASSPTANTAPTAVSTTSSPFPPRPQ